MTAKDDQEDPLLLPKALSIFEKIKFLAKDTAFYGAIAAIAKFSSLFSFPILARVLEKSELSVLDIVGVFETLVIVTFVFGQDRSLARFLHEEEDNERRRALVVESLISHVGMCLVGISFLYLFLDQLIGIYGLPATTRPIFLMLLVKLPFTMIVFFSISLLKWTFSRRKFVILNLGVTFSVVTITIFTVLLSSNKIFDVVFAITLVQIVFSCIALYLIRDWLSWKKATGTWKRSLLFAAPFGVVNIVESIIPSIDRGSVINMFGLETMAVYSVAHRIASLFQMWATAFRVAWSPFQLALFKEKDFEKTFQEITLLYSAVAGFIVVSLSIIGPYAVYVLAGDRYMEATSYISPLIAGLALQTISWVTGAGNFLAKKSNYAMYGPLIQVVFLVIGISILAPPFGLYGIAWAVFFSYLAELCVTTFLGIKALPMELPLFRVMVNMGWALVVSVWITQESYWRLIGQWEHVGSSLIAVFAFVIPIWFFGLTRPHREKAKEIILRVTSSLKSD